MANCTAVSRARVSAIPAISYADGDEAFSDLQMVGRVDAGIDLVDHPGDSTVTFTRTEG
jgi:hypothetical protein